MYKLQEHSGSSGSSSLKSLFGMKEDTDPFSRKYRIVEKNGWCQCVHFTIPWYSLLSSRLCDVFSQEKRSWGLAPMAQYIMLLSLLPIAKLQ
jgi:hypothetical protein